MTGPLFEATFHDLPEADEPHTVPSGYWKIVVAREGSDLKVAAFIYERDTPSGGSIGDQIVTLGAIEQRSGLTFLRELATAVKTTIRDDDIGPPTWVAGW